MWLRDSEHAARNDAQRLGLRDARRIATVTRIETRISDSDRGPSRHLPVQVPPRSESPDRARDRLRAIRGPAPIRVKLKSGRAGPSRPRGRVGPGRPAVRAPTEARKSAEIINAIINANRALNRCRLVAGGDGM